MDSHNSKLCRNGINILWGLSLLPHLAFVALLSSLERGKHGRSHYGKNTTVEDTPPFDDAGDVDISVARSGVVHGNTRPDKSTGSTCKCGDGGDDGSGRRVDGT